MSSCEDSNINKSYVIQTVGDVDIFSACTEIYLTNIVPCTGDTININSNLNVSGNISGTTYYGDGSQLSGIITTDNYVTGGVYSASTKSLYFTGTTGFTPFTIDVSQIVDSTNNYVTGGTYNPSTDTISLVRNDNVTVDITGVTDTFTTGGTYDNGTALITFVKNDNTSYTVDLSGIDVNDTFVTGSTLNGDVLTITRNDGFNIVVTGFSQTFTGNTSGTCIGDIYVSNIHSCSPLRINSNDEGNVYFGSTSGITIDVLNQRVGIGTNSPTEALVVSGNTIIGGTLNVGTLGTGTSVNNLGIDSGGNIVVGITGDTDTNTFVTGGTLSGNDLILEKNNNVDVNPIDLSGLVSGKTDLTLFNTHTGDTSNPHQTSFSNLTSTAHTHSISDVINLQTELDGKTDNTDFISHTGDTNNPHQTSFTNLTSTAHTHNISDVINLQTELDSKLDVSTFNSYSGNVQTELNTKISGATNLSSEGVFAQKNGLDLEFKGITSTGGTVNISSNSSSVNLEVTFPTDQDKFVSGGTYNGGTKEINFVGNSVDTTFDVDLTPLVSSVSANTYVIDGVYIDSTDTLSLLRNDGNFVNITGITDTFTTGATYDNGTTLATFTKNDGTTYTLDLSTIDVNDTFVTGQTFSNSTYILSTTRNDGTTFNTDLSVLASDVYVVSGVYNPATGIVTYTNSSGGTFQVSGFTTGMTDSYTTAANLNGETIEFDNNIQGSNLYNVSLSPVLSGKTNNTDFVTHTGDTSIHFTKGSINLSDLGNTAHTHTLSDITDFNSYSGSVQTQLDAKVGDGINSGGANEVFSGKSGTDLYFRTISGGSNTTISTIDDIIKVDVTIPPDTNTFVTGFTYNDANTFTISRNGGLSALTATINTLTGLTIDGVLSASTYTGITLNDLDDVTTNIPATPDNTYQGELMYFDVVSNQWVSGAEYGTLGTVTIWGKKGSAGTIDKGLPVYIVGFDDDIHEVELANATTATTMPVIGFTAEDFDNAGVYPLVTFGKITGLDTTSTISTLNPNGETWAVNDVLYMSTTTGGLTKNRPSGTNTQIQRIAKVLKVDATGGQLFIFNTARTAGLPNLTTDYLWVGNGDDTPQEVIRTDVGITTTGFTYNDNNTFTITDDNGGSFSSTINQMSGLTINGNLDVTGDTTLNTLTATSITSNSAINVFNGHINLRDNSYFLQGRTNADVNVSLIGVDNQDRVFIGNAGYDTYIDSDTIVDGGLTATTLNITTIGSGTPVGNLGFDSNGQVVTGTTGVSDANKIFSWFMNVT